MNSQELKKLLDYYYNSINAEKFIKNDPIQIPKLFSKKQDIEISGFLASILAIGNRVQIINNAKKLMNILQNSPYHYIINMNTKSQKDFHSFKHRFISGNNIFNICLALKRIYLENGGLENLFTEPYLKTNNLKSSLVHCYHAFSSYIKDCHTLKYISNVNNNSAAKRLNLFIRWMVRKDEKNIDFGIWNKIKPSDLYIPLDVHIAKISRELKILHRKSNDWKSVEEITNFLKKLNPTDPIKYDLALYEYSFSKKLKQQ